MRTSLLETATAKSTRVNDKNNFVAAKVCSLQNEPWKWTFWERILLSRRIVLVPNSTHFESKERNSTLLANEEAHNFLRSQQANSQSRKQLLRINCPITNLWIKQTVLRRNFFAWREFIVGQKEENRRSKQSTPEVRYKCLLLFSSSLRVSGRSYLNQKNHKHTLCTVG